MNPGRPLERRTPLRVVSPMKRGKSLSRDREPRAGTPGERGPAPARKRPRDTGPPTWVKLLVVDRAAGRCELCGHVLHDGDAWVAEHSFHHRRPRGMGGTTDPAANTPANLLLLCGSGVHGCHGLAESQRVMAASLGWLVPFAQAPAEVPVDLHTTPPGHRTVLDDEGGATHTTDWRNR